VPTFVAGIQLISTGPVGVPPVASDSAALIAKPLASPTGSNTTPMNGFGNGVGIGPAGVGTISKWMSTPTTISIHVLASTSPDPFGCAPFENAAPYSARKPEAGGN